MKRTIFALLIMCGTSLSAQLPRPSLKDVSLQLNKELPKVYDNVTKLIATSVNNNNFSFHFMLDASPEEYAFALPKVKAQILNTICTKTREASILKEYKANIVYRYEGLKGNTLGQFMVSPDHCLK
jgi:hypothetical protein